MARLLHLGNSASISDVASLAGVSTRTVSRVLNASDLVNADTRSHVEAVIAQLGYQPSARARGLRRGQSFLLGFVHNDANELVLGPIQRKIISAASNCGYELIAHPTPLGEPNLIKNVLDFVRRSRVDGLLVMAPVSGVPGLGDALAEVGLPTSALSAVPIDGFSSVTITRERNGAALAARHLLDLGHRRFALVLGPDGLHSAEERRLGFENELRGAGVQVLGTARGDYSFASGVAAAQSLLHAGERPTAIFAANDVMAAGILKEAAARGIKVPSDMSVVGFDGSILAHMLMPSLTTVYRPIADLAAVATRTLMRLIEDQPPIEEVKPELELWVRESSGPPPGAG